MIVKIAGGRIEKASGRPGLIWDSLPLISSSSIPWILLTLRTERRVMRRAVEMSILHVNLSNMSWSFFASGQSIYWWSGGNTKGMSSTAIILLRST
jgi:hypothetical protein